MLRIINDHGCPGERLESDPMQPDRATKRADCHDAAGAAKHDGEASDKPVQSQSMPGAIAQRCPDGGGRRPYLGTNAPLPSSK